MFTTEATMQIKEIGEIAKQRNVLCFSHFCRHFQHKDAIVYANCKSCQLLDLHSMPDIFHVLSYFHLSFLWWICKEGGGIVLILAMRNVWLRVAEGLVDGYMYHK
jgi:hypothetical protein